MLSIVHDATRVLHSRPRAGSAIASLCFGMVLLLESAAAWAQNDAAATQLSKDSLAALNKLYAAVPAAKALGPKAHAILVFPSITKAVLGIGG